MTKLNYKLLQVAKDYSYLLAIGFVLGAFIYFVLSFGLEIRDAVAIAAAGVAAFSALLSWHNIKLSQRAWVTITPVRFVIVSVPLIETFLKQDGTFLFGYDIELENSGKTPARNIDLRIDLLRGDDVKGITPSSIGDTQTGLSISPNAKTRFSGSIKKTWTPAQQGSLDSLWLAISCEYLAEGYSTRRGLIAKFMLHHGIEDGNEGFRTSTSQLILQPKLDLSMNHLVEDIT